MKKKNNKTTILQGFEWYLPDDSCHWNKLAGMAEKLYNMGITAIWLPPAYKCTGGVHDVGYGVYDMYDLGEFEQKGSIPTKYGTKEQYLSAIKALQAAGIKVYADIVFNHRMGADDVEEVRAIKYSGDNRCNRISDAYPILAWTKFNFSGRGGAYSDFTWNHTHFDGVDWDDREKCNGIYLFEGKSWEQNVDTELGNYDYLMGADLDMENEEVISELDNWGSWYVEQTDIDGFRLDAVKHINFKFYTNWLKKLRAAFKKELPAVAEYWNPDVSALCRYLDASGQVTSLFDVPLHFNFYKAASGNAAFDMRQIFSGTLTSARPDYSVKFVDNHDTQPGQALESFVQEWFKPIAYALILLRDEGIPCIFYGDLFGIPHDNIQPVRGLPELIKTRNLCSYGPRTDYFDHPDIIGWTYAGDSQMPHSGMAVILSDGPAGSKYMCVGASHSGEKFVDVMRNCTEIITLDETGGATFPVEGGSVSVWVSEKTCHMIL